VSKRIYYVEVEAGRPWVVRLTGVVLLAFAILCVWLAGLVGMVVAPVAALSAGVGIFLAIHADDLQDKQQRRRQAIERHHNSKDIY